MRYSRGDGTGSPVARDDNMMVLEIVIHVRRNSQTAYGFELSNT